MANDNQDRLNPAVVGATGAIIGAGVATAITMVMTDKKRRDKVVKMAGNVKDRVLDTMEPMIHETPSLPTIHESKVTKKALTKKVGSKSAIKK